MKIIWNSFQGLSLFLIFLSVKASHFENGNDGPQTITIAVLGTSGSGVSSTIHELIGPTSNCSKPTQEETLKTIMEYTLNITLPDGSPSTLKLLDIPEFLDGRRLSEDSQILASLMSLVQHTTPPDFYLALSPFDDNRFEGPDSPFVGFLKRLELFHGTFLNNTQHKSAFLFLLTRMMSDTRMNRKRPQQKMGQFQNVIEQFTSLPHPISIVVGDNKAEVDYGAYVENGYCRLPNFQLYPRNIWEALIELSPNDAKKEILTAVMNSREVAMDCDARLISTEWENYDDDAEAFSYFLSQPEKVVEDTEVNRAIEKAFLSSPISEQKHGIVQKLALQRRLQEQNYTSRDSLPKSDSKRGAFFQNNKLFSASVPARLLAAAFQLQMPEYTKSLTVGFGYAVMKDEMMRSSPFKTDVLEPSPVGFQFPNFMTCRKLVRPEIWDFKSYSADRNEYTRERLRYLEFEGKEDVSNFTGRYKEGFNVADNVTLTAVQEYRVLNCTLVSDHSKLELTPEFVEEVENLEDFNRYNIDSVNAWNNWFDKWGSHIVVSSYGGGRMHGRIAGPNVRRVLGSQANNEETLNSIVNFAPFPVKNLGVPSYRWVGGKDFKRNDWYNLGQEERTRLVEEWTQSLNSEFIMLTNELRLMPISEVVRSKIGSQEGEIVEHAIKLLLRGQLEHERKRAGQGSRSKGKDEEFDHWFMEELKRHEEERLEEKKRREEERLEVMKKMLAGKLENAIERKQKEKESGVREPIGLAISAIVQG